MVASHSSPMGFQSCLRLMTEFNTDPYSASESWYARTNQSLPPWMTAPECRIASIKPVDEENQELLTKFNEKTSQWAKRQATQLELAQRIYQLGRHLKRPDLINRSKDMQFCRQHGIWGQREDGKCVVAWDHKCNDSRLCPHEAALQSKRLCEHYIPAITRFLRKKSNHRAYFLVLAPPNYPPGDLKTGKQDIFNQLKKCLRFTLDACPVRFRRHQVISSRKRTMLAFPMIKGVLAIQEDPLSMHDDWNVHLNVILLVEGAFDFKQFRAVWGHHMYIKEMKRRELYIRKTLHEAIKYSAQHIGEKSKQKHDHKQSQAPALIDYTDAQLCEWIDAQRQFRRVRSYGYLYRIKSEEKDLIQYLAVTWRGETWFRRGSYHSVMFIQGDNFSHSNEHLAAKDAKQIMSTGPPN